MKMNGTDIQAVLGWAKEQGTRQSVQEAKIVRLAEKSAEQVRRIDDLLRIIDKNDGDIVALRRNIAAQDERIAEQMRDIRGLTDRLTNHVCLAPE